MASLTPERMDWFLTTLEKQAAEPLSRGAVALGAGATGAAIGGLGWGRKRYQEARQQGADRMQALGAGLKGGLVGAGVGGAAGAGLGAALPNGAGKTVRDFGGQMAHMWTGFGGRQGLARFGGGTAQTGKRLHTAEDVVKQLAHGGEAKDPRMFAKWRQPIDRGQIEGLALKEQQHAEQAHKAMGRAQDLGLTSIPGAIRAFATHPVDAAKGAVGAMIHGTSGAQKALAIGLPGAMATYGAVRRPGEGETRLGNVASSVGQALPYTLPMIPTSMALSMVPGIPNPGQVLSNTFGHVGKRVGDAAQRVVTGDPAANNQAGGGVA